MSRIALLGRNTAFEWGAHAARVRSSPARRRLPASGLRSNRTVQRGFMYGVFGGPPNTAGQRPALPGSTASFRLGTSTGIAATDVRRLQPSGFFAHALTVFVFGLAVFPCAALDLSKAVIVFPPNLSA